MRWTERQRAMLREMGVRLWLPEDAEASPVAEVAVRDAPTAPETGGAPPRAEARAAPAPMPRRAPADSAREPARAPGLAPADWLVVSEPLDGAGPEQQQLLDNMLRAIGVSLVAPDRERRAVLFPLDLFALDGGTAGDARAGAGSAPLRSALEAVAPRCVLAFGRAAAAALLGADAPLGGLRGRVHAHAGVPVVVTFPLAFLLRHPAVKAKAWADLWLAVGALAAPPAAG